MPVTTINLNGNTVTVVTLPISPGFRSVEWKDNSAVATVTSVFTGQTQTQLWPGADFWAGTVTLPPLTATDADAWTSALLQCQGMTNAFLIGDPLKETPRGSVLGAPLVDGSHAMPAGTNVLYTRGWSASHIGLLLPGDFIQVGYRLHRVLDSVNSDSNGAAPINVWPSLRETPPDEELLVTQSPKGLFRRATNQGTWSYDYTRLTSLSFQITEYR